MRLELKSPRNGLPQDASFACSFYLRSPLVLMPDVDTPGLSYSLLIVYIEVNVYFLVAQIVSRVFIML